MVWWIAPISGVIWIDIEGVSIWFIHPWIASTKFSVIWKIFRISHTIFSTDFSFRFQISAEWMLCEHPLSIFGQVQYFVFYMFTDNFLSTSKWYHHALDRFTLGNVCLFMPHWVKIWYTMYLKKILARCLESIWQTLLGACSAAFARRAWKEAFQISYWNKKKMVCPPKENSIQNFNIVPLYTCIAWKNMQICPETYISHKIIFSIFICLKL